MENQGQGNGPGGTGPHMRRAVQKKKTYIQRCGNCNSDDHHANRCTGPTDEWGFIAVCPHTKCNTKDHIIDDCPRMKDKERYMYQVVFRANKAPLKSRLDFQNIAPPPGKQVDARSKPWTWQFAMAQARAGTLSSETPDPAYDSFAAIGPQVHPDLAAPGTYPALPDRLPTPLARNPHQVAGQLSNTRFLPPPNEYAIKARKATHSQEHNPYSARGYPQAQPQPPYQAQHQVPYQAQPQAQHQASYQPPYQPPYQAQPRAQPQAPYQVQHQAPYQAQPRAQPQAPYQAQPQAPYQAQHQAQYQPPYQPPYQPQYPPYQPPYQPQHQPPYQPLSQPLSQPPYQAQRHTPYQQESQGNFQIIPNVPIPYTQATSAPQSGSFNTDRGRSDNQITRTIAGAGARAQADHRGRFASAYTTGIAGSGYNRAESVYTNDIAGSGYKRSRSPQRRSRSPQRRSRSPPPQSRSPTRNRDHDGGYGNNRGDSRSRGRG